MTDAIRKRGRPRKHGKFEDLYQGCPTDMRRPRYLEGIGVRRGKRGDTIWVKVQLPHGGSWNGKSYAPGSSLEIKLGRKASVSWDEAIAQRDDIQRRADNGLPLREDPIPTFGSYARQWLDQKQASIKRPDTIKVHLDVHLEPTFGKTRLDNITPSQIERWLSKCRSDGLAPSYLKRMVATLKSILNGAITDGHLNENPATKIGKIKGVMPRQRFLGAEEIVRLLIAAEEIEPWFMDVVVWALHSGMRRGEIQAMQWTDILSIADGGKVVQLQNTKSDKPRSVICNRSMAEVLAHQSDRRVEGDDRLFPVSAMTWRRRWETIRKASGLDDINFHDLRRTNATQAAVSGIDLRTLADRMGHSDLSMLERHYAMVVGSAQREAADRIQETMDRLTENVVSLPTKNP
jgi:integrase